MSGLWNTTRNCPQCNTPRPPPQKPPSGKGKGKGKGFATRNALKSGKAKGKGKQPSKWEDGPGAAADPPQKAPGKGADDKAAQSLKEARDENAQLRAQLAQLSEQQHAIPPEAAANAPQTVRYGGEQVTLGQLHAIYRGMGFLPP